MHISAAPINNMHYRLLKYIFATGLICRFLFLLFTPTFYAPDEQAHYKYVQYLATKHELPIQTQSTGAATNDWEYYQPPLYYLALAPIYSLSKSLAATEDLTVRLLRSVSILLWGMTVFFTFKTLKILDIRDTLLSIFIISIISLLPTYTFLSSVINNDNLVIAIGTGVLYVVSRQNSIKNAAICGVLVGLAMLTKLTAIVYAVLIAAIFLIELLKGNSSREKTYCFVLTSTIAITLWAPCAWRNWLIYGSITAEDIANVPREWKSASQAVGSTLRYLQKSFWSVAGVYNNISSFFPIIGRALTYLSLLGFLLTLRPSRQPQRKFLGNLLSPRTFWLACLIAIVVNIALVFRFGLLYGQGQGRFLFPLLLPLAFFIGAGLKTYHWFNTKISATHIAFFFIVYATSFTFYSLYRFAGI